MKKNLLFLSLVAAVSLMASYALAGAGFVMRVSVPFDFYIEDQLLPAGEYHFQMGSGYNATASSVIVRSSAGNGIRMLTTWPGVDKNTGTNHLRFNQYGEKYFLSGVTIRGYEATVNLFKLEKELRSQLAKVRSSVTIAQN